jgi:hypothetical protein
VKRALLLTVALAGCAHEPKVEIREVPVPTPVTCVDPQAIPEEPPRVAQLFNGNARHDLVIVADSAQDLRTWGQELRALLDQCVAKAPTSSAPTAP